MVGAAPAVPREEECCLGVGRLGCVLAGEVAVGDGTERGGIGELPFTGVAELTGGLDAARSVSAECP